MVTQDARELFMPWQTGGGREKRPGGGQITAQLRDKTFKGFGDLVLQDRGLIHLGG